MRDMTGRDRSPSARPGRADPARSAPRGTARPRHHPGRDFRQLPVHVRPAARVGGRGRSDAGDAPASDTPRRGSGLRGVPRTRAPDCCGTSRGTGTRRRSAATSANRHFVPVRGLRVGQEGYELGGQRVGHPRPVRVTVAAGTRGRLVAGSWPKQRTSVGVGENPAAYSSPPRSPWSPGLARGATPRRRSGTASGRPGR